MGLSGGAWSPGIHRGIVSRTLLQAKLGPVTVASGSSACRLHLQLARQAHAKAIGRPCLGTSGLQTLFQSPMSIPGYPDTRVPFAPGFRCTRVPGVPGPRRYPRPCLMRAWTAGTHGFRVYGTRPRCFQVSGIPESRAQWAPIISGSRVYPGPGVRQGFRAPTWGLQRKHCWTTRPLPLHSSSWLAA